MGDKRRFDEFAKLNRSDDRKGHALVDAGVRAGLLADRYQMEAMVSTTVNIEAAANRDGSVVWIARGTAAGVPYIAEADSEDAVMSAACALICQRHAERTTTRRTAKEER